MESKNTCVEVFGKRLKELRKANGYTIEQFAEAVGISKSTVHKDVSQRLSKVDPSLYAKVKDILEINKQERHIRGGLATKNKYREIALKKNTIKNNTA